MVFWNIFALVFAAVITWWLSGYDVRLTGENGKRDLIRRGLRCGVTLFLLEVIFMLPGSIASMPPLLLIVAFLTLFWVGCVAELGARWFHRLVDPEPIGEFDPNKSVRELDEVASLLKNGRREEAVQLCEALKQSGSADVMVLETLLARAGIQRANFKKPKPLVEAHRLQSEGKFGEAETILQSLLADNPSDLHAALMLMRLYAHDMHHTSKAAEVLRSLEKQPNIPPAHLEYARRSISEWSQRKSRPAGVAQPESVDELLAGGYLGTAIEVLEGKIKEQPTDFGLWLKLAEAHGRHSGNIRRAEKIVRQIESNGGFSAEQIQTATARLKEWRGAKP
jgi:hypothetical protein